MEVKSNTQMALLSTRRPRKSKYVCAPVMTEVYSKDPKENN